MSPRAHNNNIPSHTSQSKCRRFPKERIIYTNYFNIQSQLDNSEEYQTNDRHF